MTAPIHPSLLRRIWLWQHFKRNPGHIGAGWNGPVLACANCLGAVAPEHGRFGPMALERLRRIAKKQRSWDDQTNGDNDA